MQSLGGYNTNNWMHVMEDIKFTLFKEGIQTDSENKQT